MPEGLGALRGESVNTITVISDSMSCARLISPSPTVDGSCGVLTWPLQVDNAKCKHGAAYMVGNAQYMLF
jgi:hypothetical protein